MAAGRSRYQAFISYAHSDQDWAKWLQKVLERFSVPRHVRRDRPELPKRLFPVFRDQTELASSDNLSDSIVDALDRSERLVVVCSPQAAASKWVNEEIRLFKSRFPSRPVLCLLVEGSPDPESADCGFPPALLATGEGRPLPEPLAADPRDNADGKTGARYKLIAGMLGVGMDRLRQREQQRRMRVIGAFGTAGFLLAGVMAVLAWNANRAQQEAELRRSQAEDLIEFMLVDLRDQLEPIGRLNILDSVGQQAMRYFQQLGSLGSEEERLSRSMALRQIGEVRVSQGELDKALEAFEDSRQLISGLTSDNPESPHYLFESGQSEFWVGYVHWERAQFERALASMERYRDVSLELNRRWPDDADYRMELTYSDQNLAALYLELGDHDKALEYIRSAITNQRTLVADHPDNGDYVLELANALSWLGSTLMARRELESSVGVFSEAEGYLSVLSGQEMDAFVTAALCDIKLLLASSSMLTGKYEVTTRQLAEARDLYRELIVGDVTNALWQEGLARAHMGLGNTRVALGEALSGSENFKVAIEILQSLVEEDPSNATFSIRLALAQASMANSLSLQGRLAEASRHRDIAMGMAATWSDHATRGITGSFRLALAWDHIGAVDQSLGDLEAAHAAWIRAFSILEDTQQDALSHQALRARLLHRLGKTEEAAALELEVIASGLKYSGYLPVAGDTQR
ncbi:MAG: TIR domain-containing protein [Gammaproteobacteria bacterium]|nr:TIR domain-containing protein [Gammaproteobacteria bacterium]